MKKIHIKAVRKIFTNNWTWKTKINKCTLKVYEKVRALGPSLNI